MRRKILATILICVHPISGSVNASSRLARELMDNGHRVYFTGLKQCDVYFKRSDLKFMPLFERWFSENYDLNSGSGFFKRIFFARNYVKHIKSCLNMLTSSGDKEFFDLVDTLKPDLVLIVATHYDSFIWGLLAYKAGIKSAYLHDTLCRSVRSGFPPITTGIVPRFTGFKRLYVLGAWGVYFGRRYIDDIVFGNFLKTRLGIKYGVKELCKYYEYPLEFVDMWTDMLAPKLKLPEMVLCSKEFDFNGGYDVSSRYYIGLSVDLERPELSFPWNKINDNKPLIYCSLGSLEYLSKSKRVSFFKTVIKVAEHYQDWCWVVSIGNSLNICEFYNCPNNVVLVNFAPQLSILKKARFMITHGGTNTIRECINFGVPMIAFPLGFDHEGNVARVVYHKIGVRGDIKNITFNKLHRLTEELITNDSYFTRINIMRNQFEEMDGSSIGVKVVNLILSSENRSFDFKR